VPENSNVPTIASITLRDLLDQVAARTPTPGGGSVSAVCGALACALGRMVAAYSAKPGGDGTTVDSIAGQLAKAEAMLVDLANEDQQAYDRYRAISAQAKKDPALQPDADRHNRTGPSDCVDAALALCLAIPLEVCGVASQVLDAFAGFAGQASQHLLSDLRAAAIVAEATVRAAGCFVRVNAAAMSERRAAEEVLATLERMELSSAARLAALEATMNARLQQS
jgi:glutamate formiminotransferase/formiminotetrahydrofolate cyclodeaminase